MRALASSVTGFLVFFLSWAFAFFAAAFSRFLTSSSRAFSFLAARASGVSGALRFLAGVEGFSSLVVDLTRGFLVRELFSALEPFFGFAGMAKQRREERVTEGAAMPFATSLVLIARDTGPRDDLSKLASMPPLNLATSILSVIFDKTSRQRACAGSSASECVCQFDVCVVIAVTRSGLVAPLFTRVAGRTP